MRVKQNKILPFRRWRKFNIDESINNLKLPIRIENALKNGGIKKVGQLSRISKKRLYKIKNLGNKSVSYLIDIRSGIYLHHIKKPVRRRRNRIKTNIPQKNLNYKEELIDSLKLPQGIKKSLKSTGIITASQLFESSERKLRRIRGIGKKSVKIIMDLKPIYPKNTNLQIAERDNIEYLNLPIRLENSLKQAGIYSIKDLDEIPQKQLLKIKNIGRKSLVIIANAKEKIERNIQDEKIPSNKLLFTLLERSGGGKNREVIEKRYGLVLGEKETLEEIGNIYGLSRERIRQIQHKAFINIAHPSNPAKKPIINIIDEMLFNNNFLISEQEADLLVPKEFTDQPFDGSSLLDLFADLGWIQSHKIGDLTFYCPKINGFKLVDFMEDIYELLKKGSEPLTSETIYEKLNSIKSISDDRLDFVKLINKSCNLDPRIEVKVAGKYSPYIMNNYMINLWVPLITEVLEKAQTPLYYTEIADRVNDKLTSTTKRMLDARRAQSILITDPNFAHVGIRGTYGLVKWGLRKESTVELATECIKNAGFPLHWEQIYDYVSRFKDSPKMNVRSILEQSGHFEKRGNGLYWIKE